MTHWHMARISRIWLHSPPSSTCSWRTRMRRELRWVMWLAHTQYKNRSKEEGGRGHSHNYDRSPWPVNGQRSNHSQRHSHRDQLMDKDPTTHKDTVNSQSTHMSRIANNALLGGGVRVRVRVWIREQRKIKRRSKAPLSLCWQSWTSLSKQLRK